MLDFFFLNMSSSLIDLSSSHTWLCDFKAQFVSCVFFCLFVCQLYVRAMADYCPLQDPAIPCADAGLPFKKGEILQIVDQNDALWWQARKVSDLSACAGLIPSNHLLKR